MYVSRHLSVYKRSVSWLLWVWQGLSPVNNSHCHTHNLSLSLSVSSLSRIFPKKFTGAQLVKRLPALWGTRLVTAFESSHQHSLASVRSIQSVPPLPSSSKSVLIISSPLRLGLPSGLSHSGLPPPNPVCTPPICNTRYLPCSSHSTWTDHPNNVWLGWRRTLPFLLDPNFHYCLEKGQPLEPVLYQIKWYYILVPQLFS